MPTLSKLFLLIYIFYIVYLSYSFGDDSNQSSGKRYLTQQELNCFLQNQYIGVNSSFDDVPENGYNCARDCDKYPEPRICYWYFHIEQYGVMGQACGRCHRGVTKDCFNPQCVIGVGIEKMALTVNRMLPGPAINVCYGDRIIIDVYNDLPAKSVGVHWHGILQESTPWMDGTTWVSQCPILEGNAFRYNFPATTAGTHLWHSHEAAQFFDGLNGIFVVSTKTEDDPNSGTYDFDLYHHRFMLSDWLSSQMSDNEFPGYNGVPYDLTHVYADSLLINGKGTFKKTNTSNPLTYDTKTPYTVFRVRAGYKYRFRGAALTAVPCSIKISVENHKLLIISVDGYSIKPITVRSCSYNSGETIDFVIEADQPPGAYWIHATGNQECSEGVQRAILLYEESKYETPKTQFNPNSVMQMFSDTPDYNDLMKNCSGDNSNICSHKLNAITPVNSDLMKAEADMYLKLSAMSHLFSNRELYHSNKYSRHYFPIGGAAVGGFPFSDSINNKSGMMASTSLHQYDLSVKLYECDTTNNNYEVCLPLYFIKKDSVVEIMIIDALAGGIIHPFHLHGHEFVVLKMGSSDELNQLSGQNLTSIDWLRPDPCIKDTVSNPPGGFSIIRFKAVNPGYWMFHCHIDFHNVNGMFVIFQVGDISEHKPVPKGFVNCYDFLPPVAEDEMDDTNEYKFM